MDGSFRPGGVLLGKYRVESELGRGGMGIVLRVTHLHLGEEFAHKILSPETGGSPDAQARFLREAQSAVRLRGEHVTRVSDVGVLPEGAPYIAMEYLRGVDLAGELGRRGALAAGETVDYVLQACEALAEAHALGIIHRDLKPSNLFLTQRPDGSPLVKVLDFGISKLLVGGPGLLTMTGTIMGTPGYRSPEQMKASKDVDARSDVWALGIVLYECLNGRRPFDADSFSAVVLRAATEPAPAMDPRVPRGLQAVVLRCLEKDRAARFPSIAELAAALAPFARDGRAAAIVVERATGMLHGAAIASGPPARYGRTPTATTQSGSAGMVHARTARRRYAIGATVGSLGAIIAISVASVRRSRSADDGPGPTSGTATAPAAAPDAAEAVAVAKVAPANDATAPSTVLAADAAVVVVARDENVAPAQDGGDRMSRANEAKAKIAACGQLEVSQKWQALRECASELSALDARSKADEFRSKAIKEMAGVLAADKVKAALVEGSLREAQKQLKQISPDSVYFTPTSDAFRAAETRAVEANRRKAVAAAAAHDCASVRWLQVQLTTSSTAAVTGAVAAVALKCVDKVASPPPPVATQASAADRPAVGPSTTTNACQAMNVDDVMAQAQNEFAAGFEKAALHEANKALACKQTVQMYRLAAMYACGAHDLTTAKVYFNKVPAGQLQNAVEQKCQIEGLNLRGP